MSIADIPQPQNLTAAEKLWLTERLWESIEHRPEEETIGEDEKRVVDQGLQNHQANPGSSLSHEEFLRRFAGRP